MRAVRQPQACQDQHYAETEECSHALYVKHQFIHQNVYKMAKSA